MNEKKKQLVSDFITLLPDEDKLTYQEIIDYLLELGYVPQKQKVQGFVLSFNHILNNKVIAKMGIRNNRQRGFIGIKFFACKNIPEKYVNALQREIESHNEQYCGALRSNTEKNRCGYCDSCTGGGKGYYFKYPNGKEILRCGAYPILIPDVLSNDIHEMKCLILEQHNYFLSIG